MKAEDIVYRAVIAGEFRIDQNGKIWKIKARRANRHSGATSIVPINARRAENSTGEYMQVRLMIGKIRYAALAHRLVYRYWKGEIPSGMTINHLDGNKKNNSPNNLELATPSEQAIHARTVLGKCPQNGEKNNAAKLTGAQVKIIRARREFGESLKSIAADFNISDRTVSKIARGTRWAG